MVKWALLDRHGNIKKTNSNKQRLIKSFDDNITREQCKRINEGDTITSKRNKQYYKWIPTDDINNKIRSKKILYTEEYEVIRKLARVNYKY